MTETNSSISDTELLAAEYVLGQLRGEERMAAKTQMVTDAELRHWVNWWEQRLFSLSLHPEPVEPRKQVWERLYARLFSLADENDTETNGERRNTTAKLGSNWGLSWFTAALAGFALMAMTALTTIYVDGQLVPSREAPTHYASLESGGVINHIIERYANGDIASIAVHPSVATDERVLELWAIAGDGKPVSLGLLPAKGKQLVSAPASIKNLTGSLTLAVSVEPHGGSPTGLPTGPVVNSTKLVERTATDSFSF
jgi:anti-sigma-K factor RskA